MRFFRKLVNLIAGVLSIGLAYWSLRRALDPSSTFGAWTHDGLGKFLIGFWALVPPLFFWVDWVWLCTYLPAGDPEREVAKHTHDLSRNIWLALVGILAVLFALRIPGG
jgi:hypothetical protein